MNYKDRLILALDVADLESAKKIVEKLGDEVSFYKIGLEMMMSGDYFKMIEFLEAKNKKIFADLKLYDIPQTVAKAVTNLAKFNIAYLTIHTANKEIMAAAAAHKKNIKILGVTVLTCLEKSDLDEMGFAAQLSLEELVLQKTKLALACGLDGVVASPLETKLLREKCGANFLIVTPGIRLEATNDDQKRTADVKTALQYGATNLVIGRPITKSEDMLNSAKKINQLIKEIA